MIFLMVVIGGVTRLTESGLSITEWKPVTGVVPPLTDAAWQAEFEKYQEIPQYRLMNEGMTLGEFKSIFFWEYVHRLWGRLIGVVFLVPLVWFAVRRRIPRRLLAPLAFLFVLGGLQGALGWYMVESGLAVRVNVSQYRLAAHLVFALLIYAATLWTALSLIRPAPAGEAPSPAGGGAARLRPWATALVGLVFLTITAGAFVAGLHAGLTYNTFPLMDGRFVPAGYLQLEPWWRNWFESIEAVQFNHRLLAETTFLAVLALWAYGLRHAPDGWTRRALHALLAAACLQLGLGIATLLLVVPIPLAAAHQAGAVLLLTAAIVLRHAVRAPARLAAAVPAGSVSA
jgi:cytochrome c oxidase assembly protein subunit 15